MSYAVSIAKRSPRSFISRRWWVRMRFCDGAGAVAAPVPYGALVSSAIPSG